MSDVDALDEQIAGSQRNLTVPDTRCCDDCRNASMSAQTRSSCLPSCTRSPYTAAKLSLTRICCALSTSFSSSRCAVISVIAAGASNATGPWCRAPCRQGECRGRCHSCRPGLPVLRSTRPAASLAIQRDRNARVEFERVLRGGCGIAVSVRRQDPCVFGNRLLGVSVSWPPIVIPHRPRLIE